MKFTDLNPHEGMGANSLLVELGPFCIIIDAGMNPKEMGKAALPNFELLKGKTVDCVILTHCHLDHLGALPVLMRQLPNVPILATDASAQLASVLLHNSVNVMQRQREEHNCRDLPLYKHGEATQTYRQIVPLRYKEPRTLYRKGEKIELTLFSAGHVAGASALEIIYKKRRILFTGDVLFTPQKILSGASLPKGPFDTLVMETTHGAKNRPIDNTRQTEVKRLIKSLNSTLSRGGSCLIPVFALGRMQEVLSLIYQAYQEEQLQKSPIYCAGLGLAVAQTLDRVARFNPQINFRRKILNKLKTKSLPKSLNPRNVPPEPAIYVLSSGMMVEQTPAYKVAAMLLRHHKHSICFVGYCDPDTPGGKLLATQHGSAFAFESLNYVCPVNAHIEHFDLSGHAERNELKEFALAADPRSIVLTHGDQEAREWFLNSFQQMASHIQLLNPEPLVTYQV